MIFPFHRNRAVPCLIFPTFPHLRLVRRSVSQLYAFRRSPAKKYKYLSIKENLLKCRALKRFFIKENKRTENAEKHFVLHSSECGKSSEMLYLSVCLVFSGLKKLQLKIRKWGGGGVSVKRGGGLYKKLGGKYSSLFFVWYIKNLMLRSFSMVFYNVSTTSHIQETIDKISPINT